MGFSAPTGSAHGPGRSGQNGEGVDVDPRVPSRAKYLDHELVRAGTPLDHVNDLCGHARAGVACITVAAPVESSLTVADPCVAPSVDTHAAWMPVNEKVAVFPRGRREVDVSAVGARTAAWRVQPLEYLIALEFSWSSDSV